MLAYTRFSRWLLVPLLVCCSLLARAEAEPAGSAQALHLLGYLGADYPATVANGQVLDSGEYAEQLEFYGVLQGLIAGLPANPGKAALEQGVARLGQNIRERRDGAEVAALARQLGADLVSSYGISLTPRTVPDPARGAELFARHCSSCHGAQGSGDGPAAAGLEPPPANMHNAARMDRLSLYDLFNSISLGVEGTAMPAFAARLNDRERWDLASHVASLSAAPLAVDGVRFTLEQLAGVAPEQVAAEQGPEALAAFRAQRAHPPLPQRDPQQLIAFARDTLGRSLAAYRAGQRKATEKAMMAYRQGVQDGVPAETAAQLLAQAQAALDKSADVLASGQMSPWVSFLSALLILLREGVEAILVLAAILAYLNKTGQSDATRSVHFGWSLAILAGIVTWAVAAYLIDVSGTQRELLEGGSALFASVVLLWVGVWMHDRRHAAAWQDYIKNSLVGSGGRFGFALLAFISIYRELFEIILFYETLWLQAGPAGHGMVLGGSAAALVLLLGIAWVILRGSRRLPLATFFGINAVLLCSLSVVFAGHGVSALQEAGILKTHPVHFVDIDWLGVRADALSLGAQLLALLAVAAFYARSWLNARRTPA